MKNVLLKAGWLLSVITFLSCAEAQDISDIIKPVKVNAGKTDSVKVSDLFYSENYDIEFGKNPNLSVNYKNGYLYIRADSGFNAMTTLPFTLDGEEYALPVKSEFVKSVEFSFDPEKDYEKINLIGTFNSWDRNNLVMHDEDGDGIFTISIPLKPGEYQYKFYADGEELTDPLNDTKVPNGLGDYNSFIIVKEDESSKIYLHIKAYDHAGGKTVIKFFSEQAGRHSLTVQKENVFALLGNKPVDAENVKVNGGTVSIEMDSGLLEGKKLLRVAVNNNNAYSNIQNIMLFNGKPSGYDETDKFTWYDGIIYSVMIDRFADGNKELNAPLEHDSLFVQANYQGGDFQGIIDKLEEGYFDSLGINTLWISPVYDNPEKAYREYPAPHRWYSGYHGYWPISATETEQRFGSMDKLKELVSKAHDHNIKVLLDFVSNHVHENHSFYKEHPEWFGKLDLPDGRKNLRFWDEYRLTTWFEPYLPSFDYLGSQEAIDTMTSNAVWWLEETGADGFRHDAVKHVPNEFWRELTRKLKQEISAKRELPVYQIGETFGGYGLVSSYVNNGQLNAQFNFNLYDQAHQIFLDPERSFASLDKEMKRTFDVYGVLHEMGNIMDSHDKNRFMSYADGDLLLSQWSAIEEGWNNPPVVDNPSSYKKAELYYAYMLTIPGLPVIYYGSEFGMTGASDPDNRRMMRFGNELDSLEQNMLANSRKIINMRKNNPALRYGDFYTLKAEDGIYAYIRSDLEKRFLVVLNKNGSTAKAGLQLPDVYDIESGESLKNDEKIYPERGFVSVVLPAYGWQVYELE